MKAKELYSYQWHYEAIKTGKISHNDKHLESKNTTNIKKTESNEELWKQPGMTLTQTGGWMGTVNHKDRNLWWLLCHYWPALLCVTETLFLVVKSQNSTQRPGVTWFMSKPLNRPHQELTKELCNLVLPTVCDHLFACQWWFIVIAGEWEKWNCSN